MKHTLSQSSAEEIDLLETKEWLQSIESVIKIDGFERAEFLLEKVLRKAAQMGCKPLEGITTAYQNTLDVSKQPAYPGDLAIEKRLRAMIRWNAAVMVARAAQQDPSLGGHIGTFASSATLYEVGFNHFWRAPCQDHPGDFIYFQGHASPGIYARSYLEGRFSEHRIAHFRQESGKKGLSSYPHPYLMPEYWQFPTVSMGLGPLQAVHTARFIKYLQSRGLIPKTDSKIWCFCGDGEMDEPESLSAIGLASREQLDNLIFVVNCNLQRLDGPVRGNGKIIQELEGYFKGANWRVLKVIWGGAWDALFQKDPSGLLLKRMEECVDGDYQNFKAHDGAYTRAHFFGKYPALKALVSHLSDDEIWHLNRGGHDPEKIFAAYQAAVNTAGSPVVILAKTIKGYGLGSAGEALNTAHNVKKMSLDDLKKFRTRFQIPIADALLKEGSPLPFYRPEESSLEMQYLLEKRQKLKGFLPVRRINSDEPLKIPSLDIFKAHLTDSGNRKLSTTMAFVRMLSSLTRDEQIGKRVVPIVPDEARTFGMEGLFSKLGIYAPFGQNYNPVDANQVMSYKESQTGQILEEGINEAGAFASWIAAATAYSTHNKVMIPFYIYYSMFGFQRIGDLAWAAGDQQARGFLIGATSGRTTLNGEGLQHQDGHSHILANTIPNCISYDPAFAFELAVILHDGLKRMIERQENIFYYITTLNENYLQLGLPENAQQDLLKGLYLLKPASGQNKNTVNLIGSGAILQEVLAAAEVLENKYQVTSNIWSATSFSLLTREALSCVEENCFSKKDKIPFIQQQLSKTPGPVVVATDYMKEHVLPAMAFSGKAYEVLGTNGFGFSDTRAQLRRHFKVDRDHIVLAALKTVNVFQQAKGEKAL